MDPLTQLLVQRAQQQPVPATPPTPHPKVPQAMKRFENAQAIQEAYRSGWQPNPVILRAMLGNR